MDEVTPYEVEMIHERQLNKLDEKYHQVLKQNELLAQELNFKNTLINNILDTIGNCPHVHCGQTRVILRKPCS